MRAVEDDQVAETVRHVKDLNLGLFINLPSWSLGLESQVTSWEVEMFNKAYKLKFKLESLEIRTCQLLRGRKIPVLRAVGIK